MQMEYLCLEDRTPDTQYRDLLRLILDRGERQEVNNQAVPCTTFFKPLDLRFDLRNGAPIITERKIGFWRKAIGEIFAMINGAHTVEEFKAYGCDWWEQWGTKEVCDTLGLPEGDFGPGSYGVAFHNFPTPGLPNGFNQFAALVQGLREKPWSRTNMVSPWVPYYASEFGDRKVFIAPCHGWVTCYVYGDCLDTCVEQRSCDVTIGLPANLAQYTALSLALAQVTGLKPRYYVHAIKNAHIYDDQMEGVWKMLAREPRRLPTLQIIDPEIKDLFAFRAEHFEITDYDPHPPIGGIPVAF
ncbi:MAG: thymidylate synthase [Candidatus Paceibacterota bacterium]|jgi:thymidylate synthase